MIPQRSCADDRVSNPPARRRKTSHAVDRVLDPLFFDQTRHTDQAELAVGRSLSWLVTKAAAIDPHSVHDRFLRWAPHRDQSGSPPVADWQESISGTEECRVKIFSVRMNR